MKFKPIRIQRKRARGWKMPPNTIYVGRPTVWGNPFIPGAELIGGETLTAAKAVDLYRQYLTGDASAARLRDLRHCLAGRDLACWCPLDQPCHADVLLELANGPLRPTVRV